MNTPPSLTQRASAFQISLLEKKIGLPEELESIAIIVVYESIALLTGRLLNV